MTRFAIAQRNQAIEMLDCGTSNRQNARFLLSSNVLNYSIRVHIPVNRNWRRPPKRKIRKPWCRWNDQLYRLGKSYLALWSGMPLKRCPGGFNTASVNVLVIQDTEVPKTSRSKRAITWNFQEYFRLLRFFCIPVYEADNKGGQKWFR